MALVDQIISAESGGNPNATNPRSSAVGPGQFLSTTWLSMVRQHRPDLAEGKTDDQILAMRTDPALSREMTQAYASDNGRALSSAGLPVTPATTYLAHFAGPGGAINLLKADPNASAADILGPAAAKANPFLSGMTVSDLQRWAGRKVGDGGGGAVATVAAPPASQAVADPFQLQVGQTGTPVAPAAQPSAPAGMLDPNALAQNAPKALAAMQGLLGGQQAPQPQPMAPLQLGPTPFAQQMRANLLASILRPA